MKKNNILMFLLFVVGFLWSSPLLQAQSSTLNRCGTFGGVQNYKAQHPDFEQRMAKMTARWEALKQEKKAVEDITVPVVFHILHNIESGAITGNNISDEQIQSQIDRLNLDYAALNADIGEVPAVFASAVAMNSNIQFCLAQVSPSGQPSNGINRVYTTTTDFDTPPATGGAEPMKFTAQGGADAWPSCQYLNIWVLPSIDGGSTLGYAQFPASLPNAPGTDENTDGVVLAHNFVGDQVGTAELPFDMGRTATHEVGHWLGLYHTFEGGCAAPGDEVDDTPTQSIPTLGCPTSIGMSCGSEDMYVNYMDYSNDKCLVMFTNQQVDRMLMLLNTDASRSCFLTGNGSCTVELTVDFEAADTTLCFGATVQFSDQSSGARSGWQWTFEGGDPATSFDQNPMVTYNQAGTYDVTLIITTDAGDFETSTKESYITVFEDGDCPVDPCVEFLFGEFPLGGPFTNLNPLPCGETCGTPVVTPFEVYSNEAYTMDDLLAGNSYNISICAGAVNWDPVLTVASFDSDNNIVGDVVVFVDGCSLDFTVPTAGNYILVVTEKGKCDGGPTNQIDNGFIELSCLGTGNTCSPIEGPCTSFILGESLDAGGPYPFLNPVPRGADCGMVMTTPFGVYSNEGYTLFDLVAGDIYDLNMCEGNGAGSWSEVMTIAKYDAATQTVGDVIDFTIGCQLKFYVPENGNYIVVITEENLCNGDVPNLIENGNLTIACADAGCNLFPLGGSPEGGGPFNNLNPVPVGESCADSLTTPFAVFSNEGYTLESLVAGNSYNVNICYGAGAGSWDAVLTLANYDVDNVEMGDIVTFTEGCEIEFTVPADGDYILVVTEQGQCNGNAPNQLENGNLTIQCADFVAPPEPVDPCIDFVQGEFPLGGPFNNISVEIEGVLRAPCGEKCDTMAGFEVYTNEAYYIRRAIEGASYNINICEGPGAGSWPPLLTIAYFDTTTNIVGEAIAVADSCAIDFTIPTTDNYVLIITESGNCDGGEPVQIDNGLLSISCTGNNPCKEGAACTEFAAGQFPLGGPFIDINENSSLCGADCTDTLTIDAFEVYANEAYTFLNVLEGNSYNINICTGPNAGSFESVLTLAYYDSENEIVGEVIDFVLGCSLDFTVPTDSSYILVITEKNKCEAGAAPVAINNGNLQVICLGSNPCVKPCSNDECSDAILIDATIGADNGIFDNSCATTSDLDPTALVEECFALGDGFASSLWYTFEGDGSSIAISIDVNCAGITNGLPDPQMMVFKESCTGDLVACDEDSGAGFLSNVQFETEAGMMYYMVVDGWGTALGEYCFKITEPFFGECSVGTTNITFAEGTAGTGTSADPYQLCADEPLEFSSLGDFTINPVVAQNPAIAWAWYSDQPTLTDPTFDPNVLSLVTAADGLFLFDNGTTTFDVSGLSLGTYILVPIIIPNNPLLNLEDNCTGIDLTLTYPVFTFLDTATCRQEPETTCDNSAGTMSSDLVEICFGESATISSNGDEILNTDDQVIYVLHTQNDTILGSILAQNNTGTFSASDNPTIENNTTYYVSLVIAPAGDLTDDCTKIALGTPLQFLDVCNSTCINSSAGIMLSNDTISVCGDQSINIGASDIVLNEGDTGSYILHTSSDNTLGEVIATNPDIGIFTANSSPAIQLNVVYYVSYVVTILGGEDCPLVAEGTPVIFADICDAACQTSVVGTMPSERQLICEGESTNATVVEGAIVSSTATARYVLHTGSGTTLGTIFGENSTGIFTSTDNIQVHFNEVCYISYVITENGGEACPLVSQGTPVVFLQAVNFRIDEFCDKTDPNQFIYTVTAQVEGGLPAFDNSANYAIQGDFNGSVTLGETFTITFPQALGENEYQLAADDGLCGGDTRSRNFECSSKPIELIGFDGEVLAAGNLLKWSTATESNNDFFTLQRSADGVDYQDIMTLDAVGNSLLPQSYDYLDKNAPAGLSYYRLQQTDLDGQFTFSSVITLQRGERSFGISSISPMPARQLADITFNSDSESTVYLKVYDAQGRLVNAQEMVAINGANLIKLDVKTFAVGVYFVQLHNGEKTVSAKLLKE